jgi:iron complex transport system ATP-binding protein
VRNVNRSHEHESSSSLVAQGLVYQIDEALLLNQVNVRANRHELVGLVGPNGAGKSTLLRAISGLLRTQEGTIYLEGLDLDSMSSKTLARIQAQVPQLTPYTSGFTSLELVLMGRYPHMGRFQIEGAIDLSVAHASLNTTNTDDLSDREISTLSGGERQRVFIARALAQEPHILLLDEPTANLDIQHQHKTLTIIQTLVSQGMTAIIAMHDLTLAARYCDRILLLDCGKVIADGSPKDVLTADNIYLAFGVRPIVYSDPLTGILTIRLGDQLPLDYLKSDKRIHIICGGGTGAKLMYELQRSGFTVTAGVLEIGDLDHFAAETLNIDHVPIPAFSAIEQKSYKRHTELVAAADCTVLCDMPIGTNNIKNLEAAESALRVLLFEKTSIAERDFTNGKATKLYSELTPFAKCCKFEDVITVLHEEGWQENSTRNSP